MKWLAAGLAFVNGSTVSALLIGMLAHGLSRPVAVLSVLLGLAIALIAWIQVGDRAIVPPELPEPIVEPEVGKRRKRRKEPEKITPVRYDYIKVWLWLLAVVFALLAVRSFCWLIYIDGNELKIQSPNNLGDLALHLTYIRNFASGVSLWPDNPIYVFSKLRYPAGTDLFNALLACLGVNIARGLVLAGLIASVATFYAFYRWAGSFGVAAFLFNGGLAGFQIVKTWSFLDYQGDKTIAWKSIPLSMFVPQRGMLYALPVGLLLLCHWRAKYFRAENRGAKAPPTFLPFWLEVLLYASLPLFHAHTFLALTVVLGFFFLLGRGTTRKQVATLLLLSFVPATFIAWLITDHFHAGSVLKWQPGWVQQIGDFKMPFLTFWLVNFGLWVPVVLGAVGLCAARVWQRRKEVESVLPQSVIFLAAATALFLLACLVKTAPWEWDNMKLIVWAYFLVLPSIWSELLAAFPLGARAAVCLGLFASGFVSLLGGLAAGRSGYGIADRSEFDGVGAALRKVPVEARFATFPTYNHPVLMQGRKCVLGYPGHLWTQGFDYAPIETKLKSLMLGQPGWKETARELKARYLFWGREERTNYPLSSRPWEHESEVVAAGPWGAIFDLEKPRGSAVFLPRQ